MDAPIYIRFVFFEEEEKKEVEPPSKRISLDPSFRPNKVQSQLFVIDDNDDDDDESSSSSSPSRKSKVTIVKLPDLERYWFPRSRFAVAGNSRLFFVGSSQFDKSEGLKVNEIMYIDFKDKDKPLSWKTSPLENEFCFLSGATASKDGKSIYGVGKRGNLFAFDSYENMNIQFNVYPDAIQNHHLFLLDVTDTNKIYLNCAVPDPDYETDTIPDTYPSPEYFLGYYDIPSHTWHTIDSFPLSRLTSRAVVVRDSYIIHFDFVHPVTGKIFGPALCVYDIHHRTWLPEPVQGLDHDGNAFPFPVPLTLGPEGPDICCASLMQLGNTDDQLKLALVWSTWDYIKRTEYFHCSKFTLNFILEEDDAATPTFTAKHLSSAHFYPPGILLNHKINA